LITYNVWFEAIAKEQRALELLRHVYEQNPDVCCLQEVTPAFEAIVRNHPFAKKHWVLTSLRDQQDKTHGMHGTIIFFNKALLKDGWTAHASFVGFPETKMARCLLLLGLSSLAHGTTLCIGTIHLDRTPSIRASEINHCIHHLGSEKSISSILCGDTNIASYAEITPLLNAGYLDAGTHPHLYDAVRTPDPTYGDFGIKINDGRPAQGPSRRLDLVMCRNLNIKAYRLLGRDPIARELLKGTGADKEKMMDIFPSDHAGICVDVELQ